MQMHSGVVNQERVINDVDWLTNWLIDWSEENIFKNAAETQVRTSIL